MSSSFALRHTEHSSLLLHSLSCLSADSADVSLTTDDDQAAIPAHGLVLAFASDLFANILNHDDRAHHDVHVQGVLGKHLRMLVKFVYCGQMMVEAEDLVKVLDAADALGIKGIGQRTKNVNNEKYGDNNKYGDNDKYDDNDIYDRMGSNGNVYDDVNEETLNVEYTSGDISASFNVVDNSYNAVGNEDPDLNAITWTEMDNVVDVSKNSKESSLYNADNGDLKKDEEKSSKESCKKELSSSLYDEEDLSSSSSMSSSQYTVQEGDQRGSRIYVSRNYGYCKELERGGKMYLKCRERMCPGRATIAVGSKELVSTNVHTCNSTAVDFEVLRAKTSMKRKAETTTEPLSKIFKEEMELRPELKGFIEFKRFVNTLKKRRANALHYWLKRADAKDDDEENNV